MSCLQCNHIYGHADGCPQGQAEMESDLQSLRERVTELETQLAHAISRIESLESFKEEYERSVYWKNSEPQY